MNELQQTSSDATGGPARDFKILLFEPLSITALRSLSTPAHASKRNKKVQERLTCLAMSDFEIVEGESSHLLLDRSILCILPGIHVAKFPPLIARGKTADLEWLPQVSSAGRNAEKLGKTNAAASMGWQQTAKNCKTRLQNKCVPGLKKMLGAQCRWQKISQYSQYCLRLVERRKAGVGQHGRGQMSAQPE